MEKILQSDPRAGYLAHKQEIDDAINNVLCSGRYILGNETSSFEEEFAEYIGVNHCIGVASGTDALILALRACGICHGDMVATTSNTAVATVAAIDLIGAIPVLVDIDIATYTIDIGSLEHILKINKNIKAVIAVHLYGHPCIMSDILHIANEHGIKVIEDCAQSHGASINGVKTGSFGDVSAFSFYPTKNLGAIGDGGAVVTNNADIADMVRSLREYGWKSRYISSLRGMNSRLDEIQSAILRVKLKYLDIENDNRVNIAMIYNEQLRDSAIKLTIALDGYKHVYHQYVIRTAYRDLLLKYLAENGICTAIHYPLPVHMQSAYDTCLYYCLDNTENIYDQILSLPMHGYFSVSDAFLVTKKVNDFIENYHEN